MYKLAVVLAALAAAVASPALADRDDHGHKHGRGHDRDWRDDDRGRWRDHDRSRWYGSRDRDVYISINPGFVGYRSAPRVYDNNCRVERRWSHGGYRESVRCSDAPWGHSYVKPVVYHHTQVVEVPRYITPPPSGPVYGDYYQNAGGQYCREYHTFAKIGSKTQEVYGNACLQPDGAWAFNR